MNIAEECKGACQIGSGAFGEWFWLLYMVVRHTVGSIYNTPRCLIHVNGIHRFPSSLSSSSGLLRYLLTSTADPQVQKVHQRIHSRRASARKNSASATRKTTHVYAYRAENELLPFVTNRRGNEVICTIYYTWSHRTPQYKEKEERKRSEIHKYD